ncbi:MAG: glycosyltransferase family 2 protein [Nitrososphaeria archaeon]
MDNPKYHLEDNNPWQVHLSKWLPEEFSYLGFKVYGVNGIRSIYSERTQYKVEYRFLRLSFSPYILFGDELLRVANMNNEKVCAIVVTFNRKKTLLECLFALLSQTYPLTSIIVIDGPSTDGTEKALIEHGFIKDVPPSSNEIRVWHTENNIIQNDKLFSFYYIRIYDDVGGSGGFHEGFKKAYCEGYEWMWVMDDDVIPSPTALEKLILALKNGYDAARPALLDGEDFSPWFAGGIFSKRVIEKVGLPLKEFFIYWDDIEYITRCQRNGIKILDVPDAKVSHKDWLHKGMKYRILFGIVIARPIFPKGRKYYYIQRNKIYFYLKYRMLKNLIYHLTLGLIIDLIAYLILKDSDKVLSILKGSLDAFLGKTGKSKWAHAR